MTLSNKLPMKNIAHFIAFSFLTMLTQIGGIIYLISMSLNRFFVKKTQKQLSKMQQLFNYAMLYLIICLGVLPSLAPYFGRVPLPMISKEDSILQSRSLFTIVCNRHYVKKEVLDLTLQTAKLVNKTYPRTTLFYLDANFPFIDGFPLLPHKSHDDGEKLDIAFLYKNPKTGQRINSTPSFLGYGVCEEPKKHEENRPEHCKKKGYWQYSFLQKIIPQGSKAQFEFDHKANKYLLEQLANNKSVGKIFIEPHLKTRLELSKYDKIRFHGCAAVRHDDHIHIQL